MTPRDAFVWLTQTRRCLYHSSLLYLSLLCACFECPIFICVLPFICCSSPPLPSLQMSLNSVCRLSYSLHDHQPWTWMSLAVVSEFMGGIFPSTLFPAILTLKLLGTPSFLLFSLAPPALPRLSHVLGTIYCLVLWWKRASIFNCVRGLWITSVKSLMICARKLVVIENEASLRTAQRKVRLPMGTVMEENI